MKFYDEQPFRVAWVWWLVLVVGVLLTAVFLYAMVEQLILGHPVGSRPLPDTALFVVGAFFIMLCGLVFYIVHTMSLLVKVDDRELTINLRPIAWETIALSEIKTCSSRTYDAIKEFGGYGYRYSNGVWAYVVGGTQGVELELDDGGRRFIGCERAGQLLKAIRGETA